MACRHHWKIASPNGATSLGVCQHCGKQRRFPNASEADVWSDASGKARRDRVFKVRTQERTTVNHVVW